jgi:hypothetical protein
MRTKLEVFFSSLLPAEGQDGRRHHGGGLSGELGEHERGGHDPIDEGPWVDAED